jgi:hypothetical protein
VANSAILKRIGRLEAAVGPGMIVYEVSDDTPQEERERFLKEAVGEIPPGTLVVAILRFFSPGFPPRLIRGGPMPTPEESGTWPMSSPDPNDYGR